MDARQKALSHAVRARVLGKYGGQLLIVAGVFNLAPSFVALFSREFGLMVPYIAVCAVFLLLGFILSRVPAPSQVQTNEALVIVALAFCVTPLAISYPMWVSGLPYIDALFEAISAVTTTGLSTAASVEQMPRTFVFARAWAQWLGGLGLVVLSLAIIVRPGSLARQLSVSDTEQEDLVGSTRTHARTVLAVYLVLTAAGVGLLVVAGIPPFRALVHVLAAVSTGGFSDRDSSLAGLDGLTVAALVLLVCLSCAVSLSLYERARRKGWRQIPNDLQMRGILVGVVAVAALLVLLSHLNATPGGAMTPGHALLMAVSAQTTSGFSTVEVAGLDGSAKLLLIVSMLIGGGVGSTAGGVKIIRLLIFLRLAQTLVVQASLPRRAVVDVRLRGERLDATETRDALTVLVLFATVVMISWVVFLSYGHAPLDSLFEVVSATATVGLSTGVSRPDLATPLKALLCADMLLGRLEIVAFLVLVYPRTWVGKRRVQG